MALERLRVLGEVSCPAFVDVSGKVACSVEQLNLILQTAAEEEERNRCMLLALVCVWSSKPAHFCNGFAEVS